MKTEFLLQRGSNSFLPLDLFTETVEAELSQVKDQRKVLSDSAFPGCSISQPTDHSTLWQEYTNCMAATLASNIHLTTSDHETMKNQKMKGKIKHIAQRFAYQFSQLKCVLVIPCLLSSVT